LRAEVGNDAARLFYVMRSNDQHLDFDLQLATARSNDNPVYYIQYAHARVASVMRQVRERGLAHDLTNGLNCLNKLIEPQELQLIKRVSAFPEIVRQCAAQRAPHTLVHYLRDLANDFHTNYSAHQFIVEDAGLRDARLVLALAAQIVIRNGLELLGVSAPETM
jgi:arginyl-tRNA synthetase